MTNIYSDISDMDLDISLHIYIRNHILLAIDFSTHIRILTYTDMDIFVHTYFQQFLLWSFLILSLFSIANPFD